MQSLWNSKWRLNQLAFVLPDESLRSKKSKSSRPASESLGPDEVTPFEVNHPAAYVAHEDMVKQCKQGKSNGEVALKASPIRQIYTYMCLSKSTYGTLSTYQRTWFICRALEVKNGEEWSVIKFSRPFYPTSSEPTLAQAIVYVTWLAQQPCVPLCQIPKRAQRRGVLYQNQNSQL